MLDADDFLDENALLVLSHFLDHHSELGLVYPNYTYVDEHGTIIGTEYRKKIGTEYHFRLSPRDKRISVEELIEKLTPILKELEVQGRANAATMSPPTVRIMTAKIQKLLEGWAERPSAD